MSPGLKVMPPMVSGTSRSPAPVLVDLRGLVPSALASISIPPMVLASRMAPCAMMPTQPLDRPSSAMMSPTSAMYTDASPSMTRTPRVGFAEDRLEQRVVLEAAHRAHAPDELADAPVLRELGVATAHVSADLVDEVGRGGECGRSCRTSAGASGCAYPRVSSGGRTCRRYWSPCSMCRSPTIRSGWGNSSNSPIWSSPAPAWGCCL